MTSRKRLLIFQAICTFVMFLSVNSVYENTLYAEVKTGILVGQKAPTFKLSTINGEDLDLESFSKKGKTVLLVFGATWCPSCRHEVPDLNEFYDAFKSKGLEVININIGESERKVRSFAKKYKINYNVVLDSDSYVSFIYKVSGIPLNIVVNKDGIIVYRANALPGRNDLKNFIAD